MKKLILAVFITVILLGCAGAKQDMKDDSKSIQLKIVDYETAKGKYYLYYNSLNDNSSIEDLVMTLKYQTEFLKIGNELIQDIEAYQRGRIK